MLPRKSGGTQTTIAFVCKPGLTSRFVLAGVIATSILKTEKETRKKQNNDTPVSVESMVISKLSVDSI